METDKTAPKHTLYTLKRFDRVYECQRESSTTHDLLTEGKENEVHLHFPQT